MRYVVEKSRPTTALSNNSPDKGDSETVFSMRKYEFPGGINEMIYTDELTETPTVTDKSSLTEKIPSPPQSRPNTAGTEKSDGSSRTHFSVESVSFSKQSKVVKTINFVDGKTEQVDSAPVKKEIEQDNVSGKNFTFLSCATFDLMIL